MDNLVLLIPRGSTPANQSRTRQLSEDELDQDFLESFISRWPFATWFAVEFSWDNGETWEIVNLFPLEVVGSN